MTGAGDRPEGDPLDAAHAALAAGEPLQALAGVRTVLGYPAGVGLAEDRFATALEVLAEVAAATGHRELADACRGLAADVEDPDRMYDLGYDLIEAGLPAIAATVLRRCYDAIGESEQVVHELVAALEGMLAYREARDFLEGLPLLEQSFLARYQYAFNAALAGDLAAVRAMRAKLVARDADEEFLAERIDGILARATHVAGKCALDDADLRGWHYVITGGILTHLSPFGFDAPMRGRYAWLQDSAARVATGVARLCRALAAWELAPPCVYAPPGPNHEIVARAIATRLDLPLAPWPAVGVPAPGLVVAYDLGDLDPRDAARLRDVRPGQVLYAHASPWAVDGPIAADVTTLLAQTLVSPWGETLGVDEGVVVTRPADPRDAAEIARDLAATAELTGDDVAVDDLPGLDRLIATAGPPAGPRRDRLWGGSPVRSNRFD